MADKPSFIEHGLAFVLPARPEATTSDEAILNRLARLVGYTAIGLPVVLAFGSVLLEGCFRVSISHFYHTQFLGPVFVGLLFFIGAFMVAYTGSTWIERAGSTLAGLCAFGVALFPVGGSGCVAEQTFLSRVFAEVSQPAAGGPPYTLGPADIFGQGYFRLFGTVSEYHLTFAAVVFVYLGLFCLFVLRRVIPEQHGTGHELIETKRRRNALYFWCGVVILGCVAVLGVKGQVLGDLPIWDAWALTFWIEAAALWAFGVAWLAKGRRFEGLNDQPAREKVM